MIYYNENNKFAANWLEKLMQENLIPQGVVDRRSITDIKPEELKQYTQCHFFAGIGGWSRALELSKWDINRPVWTGSCPCQPFSNAGKKKAFQDERDLWPIWFKLIQECKPATIFGEQVEPAIHYGWLDRLSDDLEEQDYAIGSAVLPACGVGAPHQRKRLWWVANTNSNNDRKTEGITDKEKDGLQIINRQENDISRLFRRANTGDNNDERRSSKSELANPNPNSKRLQGVSSKLREKGKSMVQARCRSRVGEWGETKYIQCTDGKFRPIEPSIRLLVDGFPSRMGLLRGLGNAIVPQVAANFIKAFQGAVA